MNINTFYCNCDCNGFPLLSLKFLNTLNYFLFHGLIYYAENNFVRNRTLSINVPAIWQPLIHRLMLGKCEVLNIIPRMVVKL